MKSLLKYINEQQSSSDYRINEPDFANLKLKDIYIVYKDHEHSFLNLGVMQIEEFVKKFDNSRNDLEQLIYVTKKKSTAERLSTYGGKSISASLRKNIFMFTNTRYDRETPTCSIETLKEIISKLKNLAM